MLNSEKKIYLHEMELKPNKYASYVLIITVCGIVFCWLLNELGIFRVGKWEMRIGSAIPLILISIPIFNMYRKPQIFENPGAKYIIIILAGILTLFTTTLMTFHTTMMLLYPIFIAMLYRSKHAGFIALSESLFCTIVSPVLGYVLGTWDIELFKEMILIGTNGTAVIENAYPGISFISVVKILLYLSLPHLIIVGSCSLLMFYVIRVGNDHVQAQIELNRLSHVDALTGLYNQNCYKELLESKDYEGKIGVIFFDVNNLKRANDLHGHEYGDLLLSRCAKSLNMVCDDDFTTAYRIGGDEFLLVIENADEHKISEKLEQWENALALINKENIKLYSGLICSMAAGYVTGNFNEIEELIRSADKQMYRNKREMKKGAVAK